MQCNAFRENRAPKFPDAEQTPQEHMGRSPICLTLIILLQKKKLFWKKQNQNNSCPFCNNLLNSTCQTRGNYLPRYKRHQALYSLTVACVTVRLLYTISILWGPAGHVNAPPTWLQLVSPTQSPKTLVWGASAESLNAITGQGVKFSLS